jgi:MFS family permease
MQSSIQSPDVSVQNLDAIPVRTFNIRCLAAVLAFGALGPFVLLIGPALANQLAVQLGATPSQIGTYFFVELGAFSFATLPSYYWLKRIDARKVAIICTALYCVGNALTAWLPLSFTGLLCLRAVTGVTAGTLLVLALAAAGHSDNRDRTYALLITAQIVASAVGLWLFPRLFASYGMAVLYLALAVLVVLASPLINGFAIVNDEVKTHVTSERATVRNIALAILAVLAFYISIGGVWTFAGKAAAAAGFDAQATGTLLAIASAMGIAGAGAASYFGGRVARKSTLYSGYAILTVSVVGLGWMHGLFGYAASALLFKFSWTFVLPFVFACAANKDPSGRLISTINATAGAGLAIGPLIAGYMLDAGVRLATVFTGGAVACVFSLVCILLVERTISGSRAVKV